MNITNYLKAGQPALVLNTSEVERAIQTTVTDNGHTMLRWDMHRGTLKVADESQVNDLNNPIELIQWLQNESDTVLFACNLHNIMNDVEVLQAIENGIQDFKATGCCLVLIGTGIKLPKEIENYFQVIDFSLPEVEDFKAIM